MTLIRTSFRRGKVVLVRIEGNAILRKEKRENSEEWEALFSFKGGLTDKEESNNNNKTFNRKREV